jgi:hypothetical protein
MEEGDFVKTTLMYDDTMHPVCMLSPPCPDPSCRYSHVEATYFQDVLIPKECANDPHQLYEFLFPDAMESGYPMEGDDNDMKMTDQLLEEMTEFEKDPDEVVRPICLFWSETGFCLFKRDCSFAHDEETEVKYQRAQEWYPSSSECGCCHGYIYGCKAESCSERCLPCS